MCKIGYCREFHNVDHQVFVFIDTNSLDKNIVVIALKAITSQVPLYVLPISNNNKMKIQPPIFAKKHLSSKGQIHSVGTVHTFADCRSHRYLLRIPLYGSAIIIYRPKRWKLIVDRLHEHKGTAATYNLEQQSNMYLM